MSALVYLLLGCLPPLVAGPLAGIAFIEILKRKNAWYQIPFWALLALLNLLILYWVITSQGTWLPTASLSAFFVTPAASILTVLMMRNAWRRLNNTAGVSMPRKTWFTLGIALIPLLQVGMFAALLIYAPWLCKAGLVTCPNL